MKQVLFIIHGAPGSGKGYTVSHLEKEIVAQSIIKDCEIEHISTGDLLRNEVQLNTPLGQEIAKIISSGMLVSDEIVNALVVKALNTEKKVIFLDGYPRTSAQLEAFAGMISYDKVVPILVKVDTPSNIIIERVAKRRVCKDCKFTHSVLDGCCPKCGGKSVIRNDDAVISTRLEEYKKNTEPLFGCLVTVANDNWFIIDNSIDISETITTVVKSIFENIIPMAE